jgi:hypothetical protein
MPLALAQQERPVFRAGTDLVVVDVQVVDRKGQPWDWHLPTSRFGLTGSRAAWHRWSW